MIPKYRAWDSVEKKFVEHFFITDNGLICNMEKPTSGYNSPVPIEKSELILMQSTGLVDKNGKEIFEGDIIRTSAYGCIVGFGEYTYFEDENTPTTEIGFHLSFLNVTPATYAPFDKYYWDTCEVIGNIYENELDLIMYEVYKYNKETSEDK
ncbi:YopX family protein [Streptococcus sp. 27098_8_186]|uniref:YopX family protein n=1 Tax=Streptococcus sp. 27098_8_186 TaxID=3003650 RepID=UPI00204B592B|nr:MAG TPA: YopX protein [Caudoviricetes sp.]